MTRLWKPWPGLGVVAIVCLLAPVLPAQQAPQSSVAARQQYAAAVALQNRELYDTAADEWNAFLTKFPTDPLAERAQHYLGVCYLKSKQYDKAIAAFDKVIQTYPKFELLESTWLYLGLSHYSLGQGGRAEAYDQAARTFATLAEKYPKGQHLAEALFYQGECFYARNRLAEAAQRYEQLIQAAPQSPLVADALYALGVARQAEGKHDAAGQAYATFLQKFPKHALTTEVGMRRGETLMAQGQLAEAEKLFAAAAAAPGFAHADHALVQQAACLAQRNQHAAAAVLYASLPTKFPQSNFRALAELAAGKCYYLAGDYPQARTWLARALQAGGNDAPEAAHWIARSLLREKQPGEALKTVEAALPRAGQSTYLPQLLLDKADALYEHQPRRSEAVKLYEQIAREHPADAAAPEALYLAAYGSFELGDYAGALRHAADFQKGHAGHARAVDVKYVAAESQLQLGQFADAERLYGELLAAHPRHADAPQWSVRRGLALYLDKKYPAAIAVLEPALERLQGELLAEACYLLGASQNELNEFAAAVRWLERSLAAAESWRQADETLLVLAHAQRQLNNLPAAIATTRKLVDRFPQSRFLDRAHYRLGEYAYAQGDFKAAAAEYQRVLDKWPQSELSPHALYGVGWAQLGLANPGAAVEAFNRLLQQHATSSLVPRARYARGLARHQLKEYAAAIDDLRAFLSAEPQAAEKSDARYVLGLCQAGLSQAAEAANTFEALLKDEPEYAGADKVYYELAWSLDAQGKKADAARTFAHLAQKFAASPLAAECLFRVGEFQYDGREFAKAARSYYDAMQKADKNAELGEKAAHKLGWAYYRQDDFGKAQEWFAYQRAAWPQGKLAADALFMEAESLFHQGKHAEALARYEQLKSPSSDEFQVLAWLHAGQAAGQLKEWTKSLELLQRCAEQFPDSDHLPEVLYEQAWARQNLGQADEALALYEQVTAKTSREVAARARFMIGEIYFERKDHKEAVRNFFKVAYGYGYPAWQANAHFEAARCFEVLKLLDQAKKSYQEVVEKHPQSDKAPLAQKRLAELGS